MAALAKKQEATAARLDGMTVPAGGQWATEARELALGRLRDMGLPERRDEYWKFTRPDTLTQADVPAAAVFDTGEAPLFDSFDRIKVVFVDGVFDADQSDDLTGEGLSIERLADVADMDIHWAKDLYGQLEAKGQVPVERPLAALNTAFASDGVVIHVTGKVAKPVSLMYQHKAETSDAVLHHVIKLDAGAELTVLENGPAAARFNKIYTP